ncbi:MAG: trypsin-like serine protease [Pseudomonadota bacterium]
MRGLIIFLFTLVAGAALGIYADRTEPTRAMIGEIYGSVFGGDVAVLDASGVEIARQHFGSEPFTNEDLEPFGIRKCLNRAAPETPVDPVWLDLEARRPSLNDQDPPLSFPDLMDHPGLVKFEAIQSPRGTERAHCAAARIAEHWFLTAAHCFEETDPGKQKPTYDVIAVTPSSDVRSDTTMVTPITGALCHASHGVTYYKYPNDVALFYLEDVSAFADVPLATLEHESMRLTGRNLSNAYYAAWGSNGGSRFLMGGPIAIREVGEAVLNGGGTGSVRPAVGDSGSPLYVDDGAGPIVVGVLSQANPGETFDSEVAVYVRVKAIRGWIERTIAMCEQDGAYVC